MISSRFIIILIFLSLLFSSDMDRDYSDTIKTKNPAIAWKLSLVPGIGQIYNGDYVKSIAIILSVAYIFSQIEKYSHIIKIRNKFTWWFLGIYFLNIIDAYVEAELSTFPENNKQEKK